MNERPEDKEKNQKCLSCGYEFDRGADDVAMGGKTVCGDGCCTDFFWICPACEGETEYI